MLPFASSLERGLGASGKRPMRLVPQCTRAARTCPKTSLRRLPLSARHLSRIAVAATALALLVVPAAFAGKPGGGTTTSGSSLRLVLLDGATEARYGGRLTF